MKIITNIALAAAIMLMLTVFVPAQMPIFPKILIIVIFLSLGVTVLRDVNQ